MARLVNNVNPSKIIRIIREPDADHRTLTGHLPGHDGLPGPFKNRDVAALDTRRNGGDSFSHPDPAAGALSIDQMPLELFSGPAVCLDVWHVEPRTDITAEHLRQAHETSAVQVRPGDILLSGRARPPDGGAYGGRAFPRPGSSGSEQRSPVANPADRRES